MGERLPRRSLSAQAGLTFGWLFVAKG